MTEPQDPALPFAPPDAAYLRSLTQVAINCGSTGRAVMLAVPADLSITELVDVIGYLTAPTGLTVVLGDAAASSPIIRPRPIILPS